MRVRAKCLVAWGVVYLLSVGGLVANADTRLADAVKDRDADTVRALLKQKADVNAPQGDGTTALHWAAHWNDLATADLLIGAGANVNAETDRRVTPLYLAAEVGSGAVVARLLAKGANPNLVASTGASPLLLAARAGAAEAVRALLAHGADVNAREGSNGQTALMWAVSQRHASVVRLLAEHGADVHARSRSRSAFVNLGILGDRGGSAAEIQTGGSTPLLFAARQGDVECAKLLLAFGANVNDTGADGNSALVVAAHSGHGALAAFLLEAGANPNADGAGYSVLHAAVLRGDPGLVKASLARGANPNSQLANGTPFRRTSADFFFPTSLVGATPLLLAARYASVDMMRALIAAGADPRLAASDGTTPLMAAATADRRRQAALDERDVPVLRRELEEGRANANRRRQAGLPAPRPEDVSLVDVSRSPDESQGREAAKMLLELGADVNAVNQAGNTALHVAVTGQSNTIVRLLAERGARLDVKNRRGQTPLALASARRGDAAEGSPPNPTAELLRELGAKE